ncbi:MAG: lysophospholipid acyltransferase family protein [Oligoflexia bacterium]|nr:lysophospholipid acyltransferase family protein [Oligoflexia bacterium]
MGAGLMGLILVPILKLVAWAYAVQPAKARRGCAVALGALLRKVGLRAGVVRRNLELAFPGDPEARQRYFVESYRHLAALGLEILLHFGPMRRYVLRHAELRGLENWKAAHDAGKGVIFLSNHVGNWEIMAAAGALHGGMDLMIVTKLLKPEWLHRAIERSRRRCGVSATYEPRTLKDVLRHLGRGGTVGFVLDQYAGPPVGVRVPFFGVAVGTSTALATLARRTGAAVLPVANYRKPSGDFVIEVRPALAWRTVSNEEPILEIAANTAAYASEMEKDILAHPDQWLWIHRRFKGDLSPLTEDEWRAGRPRH